MVAVNVQGPGKFLVREVERLRLGRPSDHGEEFPEVQCGHDTQHGKAIILPASDIPT